MAYGNGATGQPSAGGLNKVVIGRKNLTRPIDTKTKSISYSTGTPDLLLDLNDTISSTVSKTATIQAVKVRNDGYIPAIAIYAFSHYSAEDTVSGTEYLQVLLNPKEEVIMPSTRAIMHDALNEWDGTVVTATAPNANEYVDSGADIDTATSGDVASDAAVTTIYLENGHSNYLRAGDLIRLENEILEVLTVGTGADLANSTITVKRGMYGSTAATHADDVAVRLPFFNAYHDFDKYSVAQTDDLGRFKAMNFFGLGRAASGQAGIGAGSISIQFYEAGYQGLGLSDLSSNTESGLTASTAYEFDIQVDGGTNFSNLSFTTDSSNTKFGGSNGIVAKIQSALDTQYYTSGNLFQKRVSVGLEGGDLVFRSGSYLSTSAIALTAGSSGTAEFFGTGRIPAVGSIAAAVPARLAPETTTNLITDGTTYKQIFIRDDGRGNLIWANRQRVGTINYETGAIDFRMSEKPNAEFVISCTHSGPFSGKLDGITAGRKNSLVQVLGNTPQQKCEAVLTVETF